MKKPMTFRKAVMTAEMAMVLQRQTYAFDRGMFDRGVITPHTTNCKEKYEQLTEAIALLKGLVSTTDPAAPAPDSTQPAFRGSNVQEGTTK
jgi:hypothetical protein